MVIKGYLNDVIDALRLEEGQHRAVMEFAQELLSLGLVKYDTEFVVVTEDGVQGTMFLTPVVRSVRVKVDYGQASGS